MEPGGSTGTGNNSSNSGAAGRRFTFPGNLTNKQQPQSQQNVETTKSNPRDLNKEGNESPESGSLYSDEIPSGYNSGEQYDTISCGYMSGEAYELPDTRMELREPALEVIEECIQPLGTFANSDQDIFRMPVINMGTPDGTNQNNFNHEQDEVDLSSTSSCAEDKAEADSILNITGSPMTMTFGKKPRKKPLSFAIPIEASPLNKNDNEDEMYDESSDPGMGDAPTGGYRAVPSDTDTSAVDSDPNAMSGRHKRLGKRKRSLKNHDEAWFMAHDTKGWNTIRIVCFWSSIVAMVGACILAGVLIFLMPRNCDPNVEWYQGKVIMDIKPIGPNFTLDLDHIKTKLVDYRKMGVSTLHLKNVAEKDLSLIEKPNDLLQSAQDKLGSQEQIAEFFENVHKANLTIIVQVPIVSLKNSTKLDLEMEHYVDDAIRFWISHGADGIFLDGLETFDVNVWVAQKISYWHGLLDRFTSSTGSETTTYSRILMTSYKFAKELTDNVDDIKAVDEALAKINLLDAHLDLDLKTNITLLEQEMDEIAHWDTIAQRPWINWNLQTSTSTNPTSNAAVALQMLLPGTINLDSFNAISTDSVPDLFNETLKNMTTLRALAVPIYMNGNYKRCDCEEGTTKEINYAIGQPMAETIQLERYYNRRNRYVLVANFGEEHVNLEPVGQIYSGGELVLDTSKTLENGEENYVKFSSVDLLPGEAIVIKLPK